MNVMGLVLGLD